MKVYLSGGIKGICKYYAKQWRIELTKRLKEHNIQAISPAIDIDYFQNNLELVVTKDLNLIKMCNLMVVNVGPKYAILTGTVCEVFYAANVLKPRIPVIAFTIDDEPGSQFNSPWFGEFLTPKYSYCKGYDELIEVLVQWKKAFGEAL